MKLFHRTSTGWLDITIQPVDTVNNIICGTTDSFSFFAVMEQIPMTFRGFYQPTDNQPTVNTVRNGATVPLKFEVFRDTTELTDTSVVASLRYVQVSCSTFSGSPTEAIELTTSGSTSLRYDTTAGLFIFNWQTPKQKICAIVTITTIDGDALSANFQFK